MLLDIQNSIELAKKAREFAYSPYSNYMVGAALVTKSEKIFTGCNIENNGIMAICAERVAFCKAISEGEKDFDYIVIVGAQRNAQLEDCPPCGYCRQFINEFVDKNFKIYICDDSKIVKTFTINNLLPHSFKL